MTATRPHHTLQQGQVQRSYVMADRGARPVIRGWFHFGAAILSALAATVLKAGGGGKEPWLVRKLHAVYDPFLAWAMVNPLKVGAAAVAGLALAGVLYTRIGSTFMPAMDEGTPVITLRKHPTIGVDEAGETDMAIQRLIMEQVPEVRGIMARAGADELGIDPVGLNDSDLFLAVAPKDEWRDTKNPNFVTDEVRKVLDAFPGVSYAINQPIDMRVQEMIIGARGDVVVKVFGFGLPELNRIAQEVEDVVRGIQGSSEVFALRNDGLKYLKVEIDRLAAGRLGQQRAAQRRQQQAGLQQPAQHHTPSPLRPLPDSSTMRRPASPSVAGALPCWMQSAKISTSVSSASLEDSAGAYMSPMR